MRAVRPLLAPLVMLFALIAPAFAHAGALADLEVYDRTAGRTLPIYEHEGRLYVAGEPRHQYELRVRNSSAGRILAVAERRRRERRHRADGSAGTERLRPRRLGLGANRRLAQESR